MSPFVRMREPQPSTMVRAFILARLLRLCIAHIHPQFALIVLHPRPPSPPLFQWVPLRFTKWLRLWCKILCKCVLIFANVESVYTTLTTYTYTKTYTIGYSPSLHVTQTVSTVYETVTSPVCHKCIAAPTPKPYIPVTEEVVTKYMWETLFMCFSYRLTWILAYIRSTQSAQ